MTYQVLARRLRPRGFDEVVGQSHVTLPLRNAIRTGRIPHAILLTGPRGTGKTTLARIFACCLNAEKGPTESPDPEDPVCREIARGTSTDVQEIDAASRTSVDDVRELIEAVRYAPSPGKYRIYIVDEVHMLSTAAFNALLKTLEEPPPRSLFIFCTTNPEKIPFTVVSRCQRYDLRRIPTAEVTAYLGRVAADEGIQVSEQSLGAIARAGEGSLRDSLTLFDQLISFGGGTVDDEQVVQVLDLIDRNVLLAIAEGCVAGDAAATLEACRHAWETGVDAKRLGAALLGLLRDLVVVRIAREPRELVEGSDAEIAALAALAGRTEEGRLRRMFRALLKEQEDLAWAPEPFAVLEMALIRLASLPAGDDVTALLARLDALERQLRGGGTGGPGAGGGPAAGRGSSPGGRRAPSASGDGRRRPGGGSPRGARTEPAAAPASGNETAGPTSATPPSPPAPEGPPETAVAQAPAAPARDPSGPTSSTGDHGVPMAPAAPAREALQAPESAELDGFEDETPAPAPGAPLHAVFDRLREAAREHDRMLFGALEGGRAVGLQDDRLRLALPSGVAVRRLEARRPALLEVCRRLFGERIEVALEGPGPAAAGATPPRERDAGAAPAGRRRRQEALEHPAVNDALEILGGEILEIRPLGGPGSAP